MKDGYYGDACRTYIIDSKRIFSSNTLNLCKKAREALTVGLHVIKPGVMIGEIGKAIEEYITKNTTYKVSPDFVGHGIGEKFHMFPAIHHINESNSIEAHIPMTFGMTFAVEPIICELTTDFKVMTDGWTVKTKKGLAAQFEATVGVTEDGVEIFAQ